MTERIVRQFETGYQRTLITVDADGNHTLRRYAGRDRVTPPRTPSPAISRALAGLSDGEVRTVLPGAESGDAVSYRVPGSVSAAGMALASPEGETVQHLSSVLAAVGRLLRRIQSAAPAAATTAVPAGPARALAWLRSGDGPRAAATLHGEMREVLGRRRWDSLMGWCEEFTRHSSGDSLLHGAAGMGHVVLAPQPPAAALLVGEDIARGPADFDAGWLLGELLELKFLADAQGVERDFLGPVRIAFLDGLGGLQDPAGAGRAAVLRVLVHAHDFAAYMGWHPELRVHIKALPDLIDSGGDGITTDRW
ncbi:hypothetical protein ACWGLF_32645 [Streptomyces puniciscabiei]